MQIHGRKTSKLPERNVDSRGAVKVAVGEYGHLLFKPEKQRGEDVVIWHEGADGSSEGMWDVKVSNRRKSRRRRPPHLGEWLGLIIDLLKARQGPKALMAKLKTVGARPWERLRLNSNTGSAA